MTALPQNRDNIQYFLFISGSSVTCPMVSVSNADYGKCNGKYRKVDKTAFWAPEKPVYEHLEKERYIFWNPRMGWSIGPGLQTSGYYHAGNLLQSVFGRVEIVDNKILFRCVRAMAVMGQWGHCEVCLHTLHTHFTYK